SYTTRSMSSATKLPLAIHETPQSVTVITRQRIEDQAMVTVADAVQNAPGLSISKAQGGPLRDRFYSRGFAVDNITYDGLPATLGQYGGDMLVADMALYDRVEIVRGATGLTQGAGNPAAAINLVRKRPTRDFRLRANANLGSWDRYGTEVDVSGALNQTGSLRGRAVAALQDNKSFQDVVSTKRQVFYLITEADLGSRTLLTLSASNQRNDNRITWGGLPVGADGRDLHLSRSTYLGNNWDYWDRKNESYFASLEHRFDNEWKANFSVNYVQVKSEMLATYVSATAGNFAQNAGEYHYQDKRLSYDGYASGPFRLFGRKHELAFGASYRNGDFDGYGGYDALVPMGSSVADLENWSHSRIPKPNINLALWKMVNNEKQKSFYATTRLNLADPLKLILGARVDDYEFTNKLDHTGYDVKNNLTKYAGLIYDFDSRHAGYVSYTDIFKPQNYYDVSGKILDPVLGKNYEVGVKGKYFDGALNTSVAVFRVDQKDIGMLLYDQTVCPTAPAIRCYRAGLVRSQGVDVEVQGALTPNWQVSAGYTFVDKKIKKDATPANEGNRADTYLPRHLFKATTMYRLPGGQWRVGGNVYWQNETYYKSTGFNSRQDSYAVVDLIAGYRISRDVDLQLNINNLFDKTYYQSISSSGTMGGNVYGMPRNVLLSVRYLMGGK
ncbi:MAG: TonB-dependent siderophore receptor, partial [Candidatus Accumulibacter sp.]|nr:TonB-dependent siderophore receptor [Accumulibacter sp.]